MAFLLEKFLATKSETIARQLYKINGYQKYGLYHDDLIGGYNNTVKPVVAEAYRRLSLENPQAHDDRVYRAIRANQLVIQKKFLPESEWISFDEDQKKGFYLQPYIKEIEREMAELKRLDAEDLE